MERLLQRVDGVDAFTTLDEREQQALLLETAAVATAVARSERRRGLSAKEALSRARGFRHGILGIPDHPDLKMTVEPDAYIIRAHFKTDIQDDAVLAQFKKSLEDYWSGDVKLGTKRFPLKTSITVEKLDPDEDFSRRSLRLVAGKNGKTKAGHAKIVLGRALADVSAAREFGHILGLAGDIAPPRHLKAAFQLLRRRSLKPLSPIEKTVIFNSDAEGAKAAGNFAEIGAGQGVAPYFYDGRNASRTILSSISAYAKAASDARYGKAERFVSEERLRQMLKKETEEVVSITSLGHPKDTRFFAFADTVATNPRKGQGWVGLNFQLRPGGPWNTIVMHVKLHDNAVSDFHDSKHNDQHDALAKLGVNLVYGAYYLLDDKEMFIKSLHDNLSANEVEIDSIQFEGADLSGTDNRLMGLHLLENGLACALLYDSAGKMIPAYEATWGKPLLAHPNRAGAENDQWLKQVQEKFETDAKAAGVNLAQMKIVEVLNLQELADKGKIQKDRFLTAASKPNHVLITNHMDELGLIDYVGTLNANFIGVALQAGRPAPQPQPNPKKPVTVYTY